MRSIAARVTHRRDGYFAWDGSVCEWNGLRWVRLVLIVGPQAYTTERGAVRALDRTAKRLQVAVGKITRLETMERIR